MQKPTGKQNNVNSNTNQQEQIEFNLESEDDAIVGNISENTDVCYNQGKSNTYPYLSLYVDTDVELNSYNTFQNNRRDIIDSNSLPDEGFCKFLFNSIKKMWETESFIPKILYFEHAIAVLIMPLLGLYIQGLVPFYILILFIAFQLTILFEVYFNREYMRYISTSFCCIIGLNLIWHEIYSLRVFYCIYSMFKLYILVDIIVLIVVLTIKFFTSFVFESKKFKFICIIYCLYVIIGINANFSTNYLFRLFDLFFIPIFLAKWKVPDSMNTFEKTTYVCFLVFVLISFTFMIWGIMSLYIVAGFSQKSFEDCWSKVFS